MNKKLGFNLKDKTSKPRGSMIGNINDTILDSEINVTTLDTEMNP